MLECATFLGTYFFLYVSCLLFQLKKGSVR